MIEETRTTKREPRLGRRIYYVVMDSGNPVGVATSYAGATLYLSNLAARRDATKIADDNYCYSDEDGEHKMCLLEVLRIKD